jgi:hypothetical protein
MPKLFLTEDKRTICEISKEQLEFLREVLVDEDSEDREYFVDKDTLEMLKDEGADEALLGALEKALGEQEGIDVSWSG